VITIMEHTLPPRPMFCPPPFFFVHSFYPDCDCSQTRKADDPAPLFSSPSVYLRPSTLPTPVLRISFPPFLLFRSSFFYVLPRPPQPLRFADFADNLFRHWCSIESQALGCSLTRSFLRSNRPNFVKPRNEIIFLGTSPPRRFFPLFDPDVECFPFPCGHDLPLPQIHVPFSNLGKAFTFK